MTYPERHLVRPDSTLVPSIRGSSLSKVTAIAVLATIALLAGSSGAAQESATAGTETGDLKRLQTASAALDEITKPLAELLMDKALEAMLRKRGLIVEDKK